MEFLFKHAGDLFKLKKYIETQEKAASASERQTPDEVAMIFIRSNENILERGYITDTLLCLYDELSALLTETQQLVIKLTKCQITDRRGIFCKSKDMTNDTVVEPGLSRLNNQKTSHLESLRTNLLYDSLIPEEYAARSNGAKLAIITLRTENHKLEQFSNLDYNNVMQIMTAVREFSNNTQEQQKQDINENSRINLLRAGSKIKSRMKKSDAVSLVPPARKDVRILSSKKPQL